MSRRDFWILLALVSTAAWGVPAAARVLHQQLPPGPTSNWDFREDFHQGIPAWMSYPLPQDIGYDPSLYTAESRGSFVLVRDVTAEGQRILRVGVARVLHFDAAISSSFQITYDAEACGRIVRAEFSLGGQDGRRFVHSLPFEPGPHRVTLEGAELGIPAAGARIEVLVIEVDIASPVLGSHNRLVLRTIHIKAQAPKALTIESPEMDRSWADDIAVARTVVTTSNPLTLQLPRGPRAEVVLEDGGGVLQATKIIPAESASQGPSRQAILLVPGPHTPAGLWTAKIASAARSASFRFLVVGSVPAHPRVLLTATRIRQLRSQSDAGDLLDLVHRNAQQYRSAIRYDSAAGLNIERLSTVSVFPGLPAYFKLMESYSQEIALSALEYSLSGSPEALNATRNALLTVAEWPTWTPPWFAAHGLHTYYEVGVFTQRLAFGYDLIADRLTAHQKAQIAEGIWRNAVRPTVLEYFDVDRMPIAASNWMANSIGGAIAACVALYGDVPDWDNRFGPALADLITADERLMTGLFAGDGSEAEPAGYADFAMEGMSWGQSALNALGIRPRGIERMMESFWWPRYAQFRPGFFLDTGDFGTRLPSLSGFAWSAEHSDDPALQAFYETATERTLAGMPPIEHTGRALEQAPGLLDLVCCTRSPEKQPQPPLSRIFLLRGSAILRSGWGPDDTVVSLRVGPWFNHEHHDQGSFQAAAYGEKLIGEAGYTDYYKDPRYADYFTQAPGHNAVVLDGDAFSQGNYDGRFWAAFGASPTFDRHLFSATIDYLSADLAPAYGGRLSEYERDYVFLKPDVLIVHDLLKADSPHRYTWFLHISKGANVQVEANRATIQGQGALASIVAAGTIHRWTNEQAPTSENALDDLDREAIRPREVLRLDSPQKTAAQFLVGMRFQKQASSPNSLRPLHTTSGDGFEFPNGTILFQTGSQSLTITGMRGGEIVGAGAILAARNVDGTLEIFLSRARSVRRGDHLLFSSNAPVDAILRADPLGLTLRVSCSSLTNLGIVPQKRPASVTVDGASVPLPGPGEIVSLTRLGQGEHRVRIAY